MIGHKVTNSFAWKWRYIDKTKANNTGLIGGTRDKMAGFPIAYSLKVGLNSSFLDDPPYEAVLFTKPILHLAQS